MVDHNPPISELAASAVLNRKRIEIRLFLMYLIYTNFLTSLSLMHRLPYYFEASHSKHVTHFSPIPLPHPLSLYTIAHHPERMSIPIELSYGEGYPPPFVIRPSPPHHHKSTVVLLHGTSTSGPIFAESFLNFPFLREHSEILSPPSSITNTIPSQPSRSTTLRELFPDVKWVAPTGKLRKTTVFGGRETNAWFDVHSFSDRTMGEDFPEMRQGVRDSVLYLAGVVKGEIELLDGQGKVVILGFSQGCAILVAMLLSGALDSVGLGITAVGLSGWCPFVTQLGPLVEKTSWKRENRKRVKDMLKGILDLEPEDASAEEVEEQENRVGVMLLHGLDDRKVKPKWGQAMRDVLVGTGYETTWVGYEGVEHWWGEEEMQDLTQILEKIWTEEKLEASLKD